MADDLGTNTMPVAATLDPYHMPSLSKTNMAAARPSDSNQRLSYFYII
jgi:hypothetical protein